MLGLPAPRGRGGHRRDDDALAFVARLGPRRVRRDVLAERRDLDDLQPELDVGQAKPPADDPAVPEEPLDLRGVGVGADVEVLRLAPEQQVPHAAADQVGDVVGLLESVQDAEGVRVDSRDAK